MVVVSGDTFIYLLMNQSIKPYFIKKKKFIFILLRRFSHCVDEVSYILKYVRSFTYLQVSYILKYKKALKQIKQNTTTLTGILFIFDLRWLMSMILFLSVKYMSSHIKLLVAVNHRLEYISIPYFSKWITIPLYKKFNKRSSSKVWLNLKMMNTDIYCWISGLEKKKTKTWKVLQSCYILILIYF